MTNFFLFLIVISLSGVLRLLYEILMQLTQRTDFSSEDAKVKAMTKRVAEAKDRLPKQGETDANK